MQFSKWVTLGFGALCLVAVAGVLNAQHLYYMAAILLTLPGVSYLLGWYTLRGLEFERKMPDVAWAGEEGSIVHVATNQTRVPRFFLSVQEPLPMWIEPVQEEPALFNIPARDTVYVPLPVRFRKRGVYQMAHFDVEALDPLGVFAFKKRIPGDGELVVYPLPQQMRALSLSGAERYGFQEFVSQALRGSSVDPDGVRAYTPGDPLRHIHWRQTARTGQLSVIEFEETQSIRLIVALDLQKGSHVGTGIETTLEAGVNLAASMFYQAIQQGTEARLLIPETPETAEGGAALSATRALVGRTQQHLYLLLDALARVEDNAEQPISEVILQAGERVAPGTSLLVITARPDRNLPAACAQFSLQGARVMVAYIDPDTFTKENRTQRSPETRQFLSDLLAVKASVTLFPKSAEGVLRPEALDDADIRQAEPV